MTAKSKSADKPLMPPRAWQPFTPRGVAAFAGATCSRMLLVQAAVAFLVAATVVWFAASEWSPVIADAIRELPEAGAIRKGVLDSPLTTPVRLAANDHLGISVDPGGSGGLGRIADVEIIFEKERVQLCGVLGCVSLRYPSAWAIAFNRTELEPWWGAWGGPILFAVGAATVVLLLLSWFVLATIYCPITRLIAFYIDRAAGWTAAWRVSAASLLPGAFLMIVGIALYGAGTVRLSQLAVIYLVHFASAWVFIVLAPFFLPKRGAIPANPFTTPVEAPDAKPVEEKNPFGAGNEKK